MTDNNRYVFNADEGAWVDTERHRFCDPIDVMNDQDRAYKQLEAALAQAQAELQKTEQALFAANCTLRDLGVHPATLEKL